MKDLTERLSSAKDAGAVGEAVADALEAEVGFGSFSFTAFEPGRVGPGTLLVRSSEFPTEPLVRCLVEGIAAIDRELGGYAASLASGPVTFDPFERFSRSVIENSTAYREHWRPFRLDRQLVASMRFGDEVRGCFCVARSLADRGFTASEVRAVERLRRSAARALSSLGTLGSAPLAETLAALSHGFPAPVFLFDGGGRLQWLSDEALVRLELDAVRVGAATLLRGNAALEAMSAIAVRTLRDPRADVHRLLRRARLLRQGERVSARRLCEGERAMLLVAMEAAPRQDERRRRSPLPTPQMGPTQARVARLAAEGFSVTNIAARLGISESTARTHLRRAYVKLGVHSRAELAFTLLTRSDEPVTK